MTLTPITSTLNALAPFHNRYTNITPFTYRDGMTYLQVLEEMRRYIRDTLTPWVEENMAGLVVDWNELTNILIEDVETQLTEQNIKVAADIATLRDFVNNSVASIINSTIAVSDPVIMGVFNTLTSTMRKTLDSRYAQGISVTEARFGAVANDPFNGTGTDNRTAFQAAVDEAYATGVKRVRVPAASQAYLIRMLTSSTVEGGTQGYGVLMPPGVTVEFDPGATVFAVNPAPTARALFLFSRSHGATIENLRVRGSKTKANASTDVASGVTGAVIYRTQNATLDGVDVDGIAEPYVVQGNPVADQADNTINFKAINVVVGANTGAGPHHFGAHDNSHLKGLLVIGTLTYDAFQLEAPGAVSASRNFLGEDIRVLSCAARGVFVNPNNIGTHLKRVYVRNPGRFADGTIHGYDRNAIGNPTSNSCITVFGSGVVLEDIDVSDAITVGPTNQPAVSWTSIGYGVKLVATHDVEFRGYTKLGDNAGGGIFWETATVGYNNKQKRVTVERPVGAISVVQGTNGLIPPIVTNESPSDHTARAKLINLLPSWNVIGPDGALSPMITNAPGVTTSIVTTNCEVAQGKLRILGTTSAFDNYGIQVPDTLKLAKRGVLHILMLARFNSPAPSFSITAGGVNANRYVPVEGVAGRDYQAGVLRWVQASVRYLDSDTIAANSIQIHPNYGSVATLDIEIEGIWISVGTHPFAEAPEFDFSTPQLSAAAPTLGYWPKGSRVINGNPVPGGNTGWVCTTSGSPGTWKTFGVIGA